MQIFGDGVEVRVVEAGQVFVSGAHVLAKADPAGDTVVGHLAEDADLGQQHAGAELLVCHRVCGNTQRIYRIDDLGVVFLMVPTQPGDQLPVLDKAPVHLGKQRLTVDGGIALLIQQHSAVVHQLIIDLAAGAAQHRPGDEQTHRIAALVHLEMLAVGNA